MDVCDLLHITISQILVTFAILVVIFKFVNWLLRMPYVNDVHRKNVLITGCDSGFGRLAALHLDRLGCIVFAGCLTDKGRVQLETDASHRLIAFIMDVSSSDSIQQAYMKVCEALQPHEGLWGVINNAGFSSKLGPLAWLSRDDVRALFEVNVFGVAEVTTTFLPLLKRSRGRLVIMSSVLGRVCIPYTGAYCASKYALEAYADNMRNELYQFGVSVHLVEPGSHRTPFSDQQRVRSNVLSAWERLPLNVQTEYGASYLKKVVFLSWLLTRWTSSLRTHDVISSYEHALYSRWPRTRYVVGLDTYAYLIGSYLPSCIVDVCWRIPGLRAVPQSMQAPTAR